MINGYDEIFAIGRGNIEAVVKSGAAAAKGAEELTRLYSGYASQAVERAAAAAKAFGACKTPVEAQQLYVALAREAIEEMVVESRKVAEVTTAVVNSAVEPLTARVNAVSTLWKVAA